MRRRAAPRGHFIALRGLLPLLLAWAALFPPRPALAQRGGDAVPHDRAAHRSGHGLTPRPGENDLLGKTLLRLSAEADRELTGGSPGISSAEKELDRLSGRVLAATGGDREPRRVVSALNRVLFEEERFAYDPVAGNPDNFLLNRVLARKRGNCLGLTGVYLCLAERMGIPLRAVYVPSHCFVRYEDAAARINIEPGDRGGERSDERYAREFGVGRNRPYLGTLGEAEFLGVFLKSLGAAYSRRGMEEKALETYRRAAEAYPGLPDAYYNAGVSYQKLGRLDEAIVQYRRALALDPEMAPAHDNLGVALAGMGRYKEALDEARKAVGLAPRNALSRGNLAATLCACGDIEGGIREYRKVLALDPRSARALEGLAKAYFSRGMYREASSYCGRAMDAGCRFDAAMLGALEPYRAPPESTGP